jgi:hypothetical protein
VLFCTQAPLKGVTEVTAAFPIAAKTEDDININKKANADLNKNWPLFFFS